MREALALYRTFSDPTPISTRFLFRSFTTTPYDTMAEVTDALAPRVSALPRKGGQATFPPQSMRKRDIARHPAAQGHELTGSMV